ncbi:MAG: ribosome assembly RNA-binding protein YhbY [Erysipelotrichaceae bacterium]|nr:ribosome assembly RNA-binding protein YhbY [Erysipelotrichaceae bacterium]
MLTAKQRSYLKSLANPLKPLIQIGKDGINERVMAQLDETLTSHELVKVSVLENSQLSAKAIALEVCQLSRAEFVQAIGNRFTLYRKNHKEQKIILPK